MLRLKKVKQVERARKPQVHKNKQLQLGPAIVEQKAKAKKPLGQKTRMLTANRIRRKVQAPTKAIHNNLRIKTAVLALSQVDPREQETKKALPLNRLILQVLNPKTKTERTKMMDLKSLMAQRLLKELRLKNQMLQAQRVQMVP